MYRMEFKIFDHEKMGKYWEKKYARNCLPLFLLIFYFSALSLPFSLLTFHPDFDLFGQSLLFSINLHEWFFGNSDMPNLRAAHRNFGEVILDNCWARFKVKIYFSTRDPKVLGSRKALLNEKERSSCYLKRAEVAVSVQFSHLVRGLVELTYTWKVHQFATH